MANSAVSSRTERTDCALSRGAGLGGLGNGAMHNVGGMREPNSPRRPLTVPCMKDLMGSRWLAEPTDEESCLASLELTGCSSSWEAWEEVEDRLLPQEA